jgi:hypothetical protein
MVDKVAILLLLRRLAHMVLALLLPGHRLVEVKLDPLLLPTNRSHLVIRMRSMIPILSCQTGYLQIPWTYFLIRFLYLSPIPDPQRSLEGLITPDGLEVVVE